MTEFLLNVALGTTPALLIAAWIKADELLAGREVTR